MKIQELLQCLAESFGSKAEDSLSKFSSELLNRKISGLFSDARKVTPGSVFIAIKGHQADGHQYIADAIAKNAVALVVQDLDRVPSDFSGVVAQVSDTRQALDLLAKRFYQDPSQELFVVGVTGTNGKTSVTYMIEALFNFANKPTGVIGTVDHHLGSKVWHSDMTTPDPVLVQERLRQFCNEGGKSAALEVSSHALDQKRVDSVSFDTAIFTNLTRDHLDYHSDMQEYFKAKERLFTELLEKSQKPQRVAILNEKDEYIRKVSVSSKVKKWTYGLTNSDFNYRILSMNFSRTEFELHTPMGSNNFALPMSGEHNVLNAVAAIAAALSAGINLQLCAQALSQFAGVPGRLQSVSISDAVSVFVDYAHSPDSLENVLKSLHLVRSNLKSKAKIWTIFGCGGDRDKGKRPLMAQAALMFSDHVFITSDNPRTEDPEAIISDILKGVQGSNRHQVQVQADRRTAIEKCLALAADGDVVLIAGKGHEDYQIIGTSKIPFSDFEVARQALEKRRLK